MANINVTFTENTITVNETTSNVTVAETVNTIVVGTSTIASNAQIRAAISAESPITYNSTTGVIGADANALFTGKTTTDLPEGANLYYTDSRVVTGIFNGNVQVKQFAETVNNNNVISGNVTFNMALGTIHKGILGGNITNITLSNIQRGGSATLILQQDNVGGHTLNANLLTNWKFVNTNTTLDGTPNAYNVLSVVYDGVDYFASLIDFGTAVSGTITINGVTIPLGGSGNLTTTNIAEGANLYYTTDRANTAIGAYQGSINTTGNIQGNYILGNGSLLTGVSGLTNAQVVAHIATVPLSVGGNLDVTGNINATGNINYQNVTDLYVTDQKITLNANAATNSNVEIISNRPTATNTMLKWNEQSTRWEFTNNGTTYYAIATSTTDLAEGSNLWFTTARANSAIDNRIVGGTGISYTAGTVALDFSEFNTGNIAEGSNLWFSNARVQSNTANDTNLVHVTGSETISGEKTFQNLQTFNDVAVNGIWTRTDNQGGTDPNGINIQDISGTGLSSGPLFRIHDGNFTPGNASVTNSTYILDVKGNTQSGGGISFDASGGLVGKDFHIQGMHLNFRGVSGTFGNIAGANNISATGNIQGNYILGNGAFLTGISTTSGTVTQVNTGENLTGGPITTTGTIGLANALGNVNSVTSQANVNFAINSDKKLILSQKYKNTTTYSGNISGQGYAVIGGRLGTTIAHTSANALPTLYITGGFTIAGTNEISNVTVQWQGNSAAASVSDIKSHYAFASVFGRTNQTPFPQGTYVTSVDAANSKVFMSQIETNGFNAGVSNGVFTPGARDPETGLLISFISAQAAGGAAANVIVETLVHTSGLYAYPASGWDPSYFTYAIGTASDYNMSGTTNLAWAKTSIEGNKSILNSPYGLTLGSRTDASQMGTDDTRPRFGLNVLWDGLTTPAEFGNTTPTTGVLLRQYYDPAFTDLRKASTGPSVIFTVSEGNASQSFSETYPRNNTEIGKIAWVIPNNANPAPSFSNPLTWINCLTGQDADIGNGSGGQRVSGAGMYFGNSPDVLNSGRALYFANTKGRTLLAGGFEGSTTANITLAPMDTTINTGNSVQMYDNAIVGKLFANVGYANMSSQTGSRLTITNGAEVSAPGNFVIEIDRNVTPAGVANVTLDAAPFGIMDGGDIGGIPNRALVGIYYSGSSGIAPTTTAITINSVTGPGAANINGQTFYINDTQSLYGATAYYLYSDAGLTTPVTYSSLGADVYATDGGYLEYTATPASVSKNWSFELEQAVQDLKLKADGNTKVTFTDTGNINMATNASINYDRVYGEFFSNVTQTANAANTPTAITLNNTGISSATSIVNNSNITIAKAGIYNMQFSLQLTNADNSNEHDFDVWLRKNGTNVPNTNTQYTVVRGRSGADGKNVAALNLFLNAAAGDVYQIMFAVTDTQVSVEAIAELTTPYARPVTPSAIVTVTPIGA